MEPAILVIGAKVLLIGAGNTGRGAANTGHGAKFFWPESLPLVVNYDFEKMKVIGCNRRRHCTFSEVLKNRWNISLNINVELP